MRVISLKAHRSIVGGNMDRDMRKIFQLFDIEQVFLTPCTNNRFHRASVRYRL